MPDDVDLAASRVMFLLESTLGARQDSALPY